MRGSPRSGFVIYVVMGILSVLVVAGFALFSFMQDETLRVHRVYFGTAAIKMAEAAEAEAFAWVDVQLALAQAERHEFLGRLLSWPTIRLSLPTDEEAPPDDERFLDLVAEGVIPRTLEVADTMTGRAAIKEATLVFRDLAPLYNPDTGPLDPETQGRVAVDPFERTGMLELSVVVAYGRLRRGPLGAQDLTKRYLSRREIKVVNRLAPVVGRFTLFARRFACSQSLSWPLADDEPYNALAPRPDLAGSDAMGVGDFGTNQPLVLINHPDDVKERQGFCASYEEMARYLPWEPPYDATTPSAPVLTTQTAYRPDLQRRGWVFLGGDRPWRLNLQAGQGNSASGAALPAGYDLSWCAASSVEGFAFHESYRTATFSQITGLPGASGWSPNLTVTGGTLPDYRFAIFHFGYLGATLEAPVVRNGILANAFGRPEAAGRSLRPSLLRLYGDVQARELDGAGRTVTYLDRRSPTLVLGPVLRRFFQVGLVGQDVPSATYPYPSMAPPQTYLPYFHIDRTGAYGGTDAAFPWAAPTWSTPPIAPQDLNVVDCSASPVGVPATFRVRDDVFRFASGSPFGVYSFLMTRPMAQAYNDGYDWVVENSNPAVGLDPRRHLSQATLKVLGPTAGSAADTPFFYGTTDPSSNGCYFARGLRIRQYDETTPGSDTVDDVFPDGYFQGSLDALALHSPTQLTDNFGSGVPATVAEYDLRQKTVYRFPDETAFCAAHLADPASATLQGPLGVTLVAEGALDLTQGATRSRIEFDRGGMIVARGTVTLPAVVKTAAARARRETLTIVSLEGDIVIAGPVVEAALVALGPGRTLKRTVPAVVVRGSVAVDTLDFTAAGPGNLFGPSYSFADPQPTGLAGLEGFSRNVIEYDPDGDPGAASTYRTHYGAYMAGGISYWKAGEE